MDNCGESRTLKRFKTIQNSFAYLFLDWLLMSFALKFSLGIGTNVEILPFDSVSQGVGKKLEWRKSAKAQCSRHLFRIIDKCSNG